jgi:hypothetical protein
MSLLIPYFSAGPVERLYYSLPLRSIARDLQEFKGLNVLESKADAMRSHEKPL